ETGNSKLEARFKVRPFILSFRTPNPQFRISNFDLRVSNLVALALLCVALPATLDLVARPPLAPASPPVVSWLAFSQSLSEKSRLDLFEKVWQIVNRDYYDPSFNGVDWKAVRERFRPRVE